MVKNTSKATIKAKEKWLKIKEERIMKVLDYLEEHGNQTVYISSKHFGYPLKTTQDIIDKQEENGLLIKEQQIEKGRAKNIIRKRKFEEYTFDTYNEEGLDE